MDQDPSRAGQQQQQQQQQQQHAAGTYDISVGGHYGMLPVPARSSLEKVWSCAKTFIWVKG